MKRYGVKNTNIMLTGAACCGWVDMNDEDGYFGTDDINVAYQFVNHCDIPRYMEVFEKSSNTQLEF